MKTKSLTTPNKAEADNKEQELRAKRFTQVSPLDKLHGHQYSHSQAPADHESFEGPLNYMVEWSAGDE